MLKIMAIYCGEMERKFLSLALKLGLHPSTLARLSNSSSNLGVNPSVASGSLVVIATS
jgi:uncharacterized membrane-anchored protein